MELERTLVALPLFIGEESQGRQRWGLPSGLSKARALSSWGCPFKITSLFKKKNTFPRLRSKKEKRKKMEGGEQSSEKLVSSAHLGEDAFIE